MDEQHQGTLKMFLHEQVMRLLADDEEDAPPPKWQLILMSILMVLLFAALITDKIAPDHVFVMTLAMCIVTGIVDTKEGLSGFANEGVLTVMVRNSQTVHLVMVWSCVPHNTFVVNLFAL